MKKFAVCLILIMCLFVGCAFASTQEELINIIDQARLELTQFYPLVANGTVLYEDENIKMTATSLPYLGDYFDDMRIDVVIENYSEYNLSCYIPMCSINGWTFEYATVEDVMANQKVKGNIYFDYFTENSDMTTAEEIETIEGIFKYTDSDTWDSVGEGEFYWVFQ